MFGCNFNTSDQTAGELMESNTGHNAGCNYWSEYKPMEQKILFIIIGMSLVTYLPRALPLLVLSKFELPLLFRRWLQFIPVAVLSALLAPAILMPQGRLVISLDNNALIASVLCFLAAAKTKNIFLTIVIGILAMFVLQTFK